MNNNNIEVYNFEAIALDLDRYIQIENNEPQTRTFIPSNMRKSLGVKVKSGEHDPSHFHIVSTQRNVEIRFTTKDCSEYRPKKSIGNKFVPYVQKYFRKNIDLLSTIESKFYELNPNLVV